MVTGWKSINGSWYYLESNGVMATGWKSISGSWYYLESNGAMATGWKSINGSWYYLESNGAMATGWKSINDSWYYLHSSGAMATGWLALGDSRYYLNSSGHMLTGNQVIDGVSYTFNSSGALVSSSVPIGKSYSDAMSSIRTILWAIGFKGTIDTGVELPPINVNNAEIRASVGTQSTIGAGDGKLFKFSVVNDKVSLVPSDFPINEYIKLKNKLDELALEIGNGDISIVINSRSQIIIELKVKLIESPVVLSNNLYCKITISFHPDLVPQEVYENCINAQDVRQVAFVSASVILLAIAISTPGFREIAQEIITKIVEFFLQFA
ncbi:hypothetical protein KQI89_16695 [Clostridium sp. MSJ-4]|uniref:N-acetylmuramoyl-L-alanine amidase n=1 Tax=Clostridium simiarum TaxID=2841506 RepID=A0ABS6F4E3_9CLOT|nr:hypothetical protein [Clostridium simiarum]